jgi:3',5'-cyclic AMP phosphodiesterase CpdA
LLAVHHVPLSIGSPWMDGMGMENPEDLFGVMDRFSNVRALVCGHIHQEFRTVRNGVSLALHVRAVHAGRHAVRSGREAAGLPGTVAPSGWSCHDPDSQGAVASSWRSGSRNVNDPPVRLA